MGVSFVKFKGDDRVVTIARNTEVAEVAAPDATDDAEQSETSGDDSE